MATIKSYTDLEQSKKLAGFLPIESADMGWNVFVDETTRILPIDDWDLVRNGSGNVKFYPAWSLAALLDIIPYAIHKSDNEFYRLEIDKGYSDYAIWYSNNGLTINDLDVTSDNFIDVCVKMILKLHEQNIL